MNNFTKKASRVCLIVIGIMVLFFVFFFIKGGIEEECLFYSSVNYEEFRIPIDHAGPLYRKAAGDSFISLRFSFLGDCFKVIRDKDAVIIPTEYETVKMGKYSQNETSEEPIEWLIIDETKNKTLLLSKYYLDAVTFDNKTENITWKKSHLRNWLNEDFFQTAFEEQEQKAIKKSRIVSDSYPLTSGKDQTDGSILPLWVTKDKIFVLDSHEKLIYLELTGNDYYSEPTVYAKQHAFILPTIVYKQYTGESGPIDIYVDWNRFGYVPDIGYQVYWSYGAPYEYEYGDCIEYDYHDMDGDTVKSSLYVRPAMWVDSDYIRRLPRIEE